MESLTLYITYLNTIKKQWLTIGIWTYYTYAINTIKLKTIAFKSLYIIYMYIVFTHHSFLKHNIILYYNSYKLQHNAMKLYRY